MGLVKVMGYQARYCIAFESQGIAMSCGLQTRKGTRYGGMFGQVHDWIQLVAERKLSIPQRHNEDA